MIARHPYSALFEPFDLSGDDLDALEQSIRAHGVRNPVTLFNGKILDGWNRYSIAFRLGVDCPTNEFAGTDADAWQFVLDENMHRRSLTNEQKAIIYLSKRRMDSKGVHMCTPDEGKQSVPIETPSGCTNLYTSSGDDPSVQICTPEPSVREIARNFDLSNGTAQNIKRISEKGSGELIDAVTAGEVSIGRAASVVSKPKEEQLAAAREKPAPRAEMVSAEKYAELKELYEEALENGRELAADLKAYSAVEQGEQHQEIRKLYDQLKVRDERLNQLLNENGELRRQVSWWKKTAVRLGWKPGQ